MRPTTEGVGTASSPVQELIAGRYRVERAIGQGAMGTVWLCRDEVLHRVVAVKQIRTLAGEQTGDTRRAMREARSAAALNHRNAVAIYDVVEHGGSPWLVMEYFPSETLAVLMGTGPLPVERVSRIGAQIAAALAAAHQAGIIHRDVKPANILVAEGDLAKISDFGIAHPAFDDRLTQTGMTSGTPAYFSPEARAWRGALHGGGLLGARGHVVRRGRGPAPAPAPSQRPRDAAGDRDHAGPATGPRRAAAGAHRSSHGPRPGDPVDDGRGQRGTAGPGLPDHRRHGGRRAAPPPAPPVDPEPDTAPEPTPPPVAPPPVAPGEPSAHASSRWRSRWPPCCSSASASSTWPRPSAARTPTAVPMPGTELLGTDAIRLVHDAGGVGEVSTPEPSSSAPTADATTPATPAGSAGAREQTVDTYFDTVPDDLDAGWAMLSPAMQDRVGRDSYDGFWATIESTDATDVRAVGADQVAATVTYRRTDGSVTTEDQVLTLVPDGDGYLIDADR